jgi:hypothetical protein
VARIVIEDAVLYLLSFYLLSSILFSGFGLLESYTPGQRYNSTTMSMETYISSHVSIFGDNYDSVNISDFNASVVNPGAMLNPIDVVMLVGMYLKLLTSIISSTMIYYVLKLFMGSALAHVITFILNVMVFIVGIRVITGRIRWD